MENATDMHKKYGEWALVTGASSGIGAAFAKLLAQEGFHLILVARRQERLQELQQSLKEGYTINCELLIEDLADPQAPRRIADKTSEYNIGLVISNAGFGLKGEFCSHSPEQLEAMLNVNVRTPLLLIHTMLPHLRQRNTSGIVITGSQEGESPFPWSSAYAGTKAFVHNFGMSLYGELDNSGVDLMVLAPGPTDTEALPNQGFRPETLSGLMAAEEVASRALQHLGKTPLYIPGWRNRFAVVLMRCLPKRWRIALGGKGMLSAMAKSQAPTR